jgi:hypothetical protein
MRFLRSFFACMDRYKPVKKPRMVFNFFFSGFDAVKAKRAWLNNVKLHFSVN